MRRPSWFNRFCVAVALLTLPFVHLISGLEANVLYMLAIDGVQVATAESDSTGFVGFSFECPPEIGIGSHTAHVSAVGSIEFDVEIGECEIVPRETEGGTP